jgi:branched-chain amino acid transport system substrate-binding protein
MRKMRPEHSWLRGLSLTVFLSAAGATGAAAEDMIILGAAVSTTGKYAQNGANTRNGYDLAVDAINAKGGVTVGGKRYELVIKYYDDESTPARCTELAERLIRQDGQICARAIQLRPDQGDAPHHREISGAHG